MKLKLLTAALTGLTLIAPVLARAQSTPQSTHVATVNGVAIAQVALDTAVRQAQAGGAKDTPELRAALKAHLIARELFRQEAEKKNFASAPEVMAAANQAKENAMVQKFLREAVMPDPVTEAEIRNQYDRIVSGLGAHEYKTRIIQTADEAAAKLVLTQLKGGKSFEDLAREYSKAPSATSGGALDWVSFKLPLKEGETQGFPHPLAQASIKLKPGMVIAEPIAWNGAFYLLKLDEARATQIPAYEKVKPALKAMLEQKELERASAALVAGLIKNAKIQ